MADYPIPVDLFALYRDLIFRESGLALAQHKNIMLANRLRKRMRVTGIDSYQGYYDFIVNEAGAEELGEMLDYLTVNYTRFFREPAQFTFLEKRFVPELVERARKSGERRLRIWSAGCSSGEEPYSIAIALRETLPSPDYWDVKMLASDISIRMLEKAAAGSYPAATIQALPDDRRRFFEREGNHFRVEPKLSKWIVFRRINLNDARLPIRTKFDIIFCRNVIIYFDAPTQRRVLEGLVRYLRDDGYICMGHAESLRRHGDIVEFVEPNIYRKKKEK